MHWNPRDPRSFITHQIVTSEDDPHDQTRYSGCGCLTLAIVLTTTALALFLWTTH